MRAAGWAGMLLLGVFLGSAFAAENPLDRFLAGLHTLKLGFSEDVTDAQGHRTDQAQGELTVVRPGRFRWDTRPLSGGGEGQLLVADGHNLWYFDRDLQEVTVKPMDAALSATPAMLLSGAGDLHSAFQITPEGPSSGLDWVRVEPKSATADFRSAYLGFSGETLRKMILKDKLGQTATLTFTASERNVPVDPALVSFTPPAGADVIGKPQS